MPVDFTLAEFNDLINTSSGPERLAFLNIVLDGITGVNGLNAQDLADIITASTRSEKEALATLVIQSESFLQETNEITAQAASDARRAAAQTYITDTVEPLLVGTPTGDYETQHGQLVGNIAILTSEINTAIDAETKDELRIRRETEIQKLKQLRKDHAEGLVL